MVSEFSFFLLLQVASYAVQQRTLRKPLSLDRIRSVRLTRGLKDIIDH